MIAEDKNRIIDTLQKWHEIAVKKHDASVRNKFADRLESDSFYRGYMKACLEMIGYINSF